VTAQQINPDLTEQQKKVILEKGTEAPYSGQFLDHNQTGNYVCANCGVILFASDSKYESDIPGLAGWPSFGDTATLDSIRLIPDESLGMHRTEVICSNCQGHLGHLFDDSTSPTGKHFCINSCSLDFKQTN
jgi:peptide-methionine (R)-S-oxide reductase